MASACKGSGVPGLFDRATPHEDYALTTEVTHAPSEPQAYGYRLKLGRGRVLNVALTVSGEEPALIFIDLHEEAGEGPIDQAAVREGRWVRHLQC
jgi:hypothetical protein